MAKRVKRGATEEQMNAFNAAAGSVLPKVLTCEDDFGTNYLVEQIDNISVEDLAVLFNSLVLGGYGNHATRTYVAVGLLEELSEQLYREENATERAARLKREQAAKKKKEAAAAKKKAKELKLLEELQKKYGTV